MFAELILNAKSVTMKATIHEESIKLLKTAVDPCPKISRIMNQCPRKQETKNALRKANQCV